MNNELGNKSNVKKEWGHFVFSIYLLAFFYVSVNEWKTYFSLIHTYIKEWL